MTSIPENTKNLNPDAAQQSALIVSAVRYEAPVGKPYGYKKGKVIPGKSFRSEKAVGETKAHPTFEKFATWRKALTTEYMLVSGTFETVGKVPIVYKGKEGPGEVSASTKYLAHREQPGILIGDIDFKDPREVAGLYLGGDQPYKTQDAALDALSKVLPEADGCALLVGWSTSSNLFKSKKQVKGTGGIRIYLPLNDASKIPELLGIMHKRSWCHGEGWAFVDKAGNFQERSLFDMALKAVTQPDYAAPDLRDGLTQDREWEDFEGDYLDPASVTPLTPEEEKQYQDAVAAAKNILAPEMEAQRKVWLTKNAKAHEKKGLNTKRAMAAVIQLLDNGVLFPTGSVLFDDGTEVSVLDLLTDGSAHDGKTCKDPVDPDYNGGSSTGQYYWNDGEGPGIHSFAHGSKWYAIKHDAESAKAAIESGDDNVISLALAQTAFRSNSEELRLEKEAAKALGLGNNVTAFRADVDKVKKRLHGKKGLDPTTLAIIAEGRWPIDKPLPSEIFPAKKGSTILSHADNYKTMTASYGYGCSYDVIKKEVFWTGPQIDMTTDNAYLALFSKMKGLAALNGLPHGNADLNAHLPAIAEQNQINPVRDYLAALEWDGEDRIGRLVQAIGPHDTEVAEIALRVWFTGAAAACEHFETGLKLVHGARPSFEYVLAIRADQGVNKTKGFLGLVPKALGKYAKDGLSIKTANKDSVKIAVSYWLAELGELDATFRQGEIAELKAFLSTEADELRLPYAQGYSKFKRRTAFIGTVNQDKFLKDATGNRRYLALECESGFPLWSPEEVDQLWAQAWARYVGGAQWWPTDAEQVALDVNAERFLQHSWAETRIREVYDFTRPTENNKRITVTDLWTKLCSDNGRNVPIRELKPQQLNEVRAAMKKLWSEHGAERRKGEQVVKTKRGVVNTYADGGKNKGWLVPMTVNEVGNEVLKGRLGSKRAQSTTPFWTGI
jgi:predicted P-loop ATPase